MTSKEALIVSLEDLLRRFVGDEYNPIYDRGHLENIADDIAAVAIHASRRDT